VQPHSGAPFAETHVFDGAKVKGSFTKSVLDTSLTGGFFWEFEMAPIFQDDGDSSAGLKLAPCTGPLPPRP
jgi:hypothetical protein